MSDSAKSVVKSWGDPESATELARTIEVFMLANFGRGASGGCNGEGGELTYDLAGDDVVVAVLPLAKWHELKKAARGN